MVGGVSAPIEVRLLSACCPVVVRFKSGQQPDNKRTTSGQQSDLYRSQEGGKRESGVYEKRPGCNKLEVCPLLIV